MKGRIALTVIATFSLGTLAFADESTSSLPPARRMTEAVTSTVARPTGRSTPATRTRGGE